MKETRIVMGMPATIEIIDSGASQRDLDDVFAYFVSVDEKFSPYKSTSEVTAWNEGKIKEENLSDEMKEIFRRAEETKKETSGFFDIYFSGKCDPSGLVKGWAIHHGAEILRKKDFKNFYVEIAGDIEVSGLNKNNEPWTIGIRNPFKRGEMVKIVQLKNEGIATSGTSIRGEHIYNPRENRTTNEIASITVIGPNVYEADRFATATFAMGRVGINFIDNLQGFEGYMIDHDGIATYTSGFNKYIYVK